MADPWDSATPTVTDIVRDVTPPEFIALKEVNQNRLSVLAAGQDSTPWSVGPVSTQVEVILQTTTTYVTSAGVTWNGNAFQVLAGYEGYYRVSGFSPRYFFEPLGSCGLVGLKDEGAGEVAIAQFYYKPDTDDTTMVPFSFIVAMQDPTYTLAIKQIIVVPLGTTASGDPAVAEDLQQIDIEYLRPMTF